MARSAGRPRRSRSCAKAVRSTTRTAKLRQTATAEDVDFRKPRGLDRTLFLHLAGCDWIREHRHCLITGACGTGKSFIACALGDRACRDDLSVLYRRSSRLFGALALARGDGRYARLMRQLARVNLLILDDWVRSRWPQSSAAICWKSSRTATIAAR